MVNCLFCKTVNIAPSPSVPLCVRKEPLSFFGADGAAFDSHLYGKSFLIAFASAPVI